MTGKHREKLAEYYFSVIHDNAEEFKLGFSEVGLATGVTYDGDPDSPRSIAYDLGRTLGDQLFDSNDSFCDHGPTMYESYCPDCNGDNYEGYGENMVGG